MFWYTNMPSTCLTLIKEDPSTLTVQLILNLELKAAMVSLGFDVKDANIFQMISDLDEDGNK